MGIQQNAWHLRVNPFQFLQNLLRPAFLPEVKAQREHLKNGRFHEFGRGAAKSAPPETFDAGAPLEVGDLALQVGVDLEESIETGEADLQPMAAGVFFTLIIHGKMRPVGSVIPDHPLRSFFMAGETSPFIIILKPPNQAMPVHPYSFILEDGRWKFNGKMSERKTRGNRANAVIRERKGGF